MMKFHMKEKGMRADLGYGVLDVSGDNQHGFRPFQLMVASIAGCSGSVFLKILEKQRMEIEDLIISADVERNALKANSIESITLHYIVKGYRLNPEKLQRNLELSRKNCSMIRTVEDCIEIKERLEIVQLSN